MPDSRRPLPLFAVYLAILFGGIAAAIAIGVVRSSDDDAATETVERFATAIEQQDGAAACAELSADTRGELESQEGAQCEQAILALELSLGGAAELKVADTAATVELTEGGSVYVEHTSNGWRIVAAGCEPRPSAPDDCALQS